MLRRQNFSLNSRRRNRRRETPEQGAIKGYDPEEPIDDQPIKEVRWMNLNEMSEKDRAFMWRYGLLEIPEFCEEVMSWGDTISYPEKRS